MKTTTRTEGILPALETSHALAWLERGGLSGRMHVAAGAERGEEELREALATIETSARLQAALIGNKSPKDALNDAAKAAAILAWFDRYRNKSK